MKLFGVAVVLDGIYQLIVFHLIYPFEALSVGFLLACAPYLLLRGVAGRLWSSGVGSALTRRR